VIARVVPWFEDDQPHDLVRWSVAAAVIAVTHIGLVAAYLLFWQPPNVEIGDTAPIISIDLIAPQIDQLQQPQIEKPTPPEQTAPDDVVPLPKPPEVAAPAAPAQRTTVHEIASAPRIDPSWEALLLRHLQQHKSYPDRARRRNEQGVVLLAFTIDRNGHVLTRRIVKGSGYAELDAEVLELVERAQPLPPFPPSMTQAQLDLTVPVRFSLR